MSDLGDETLQPRMPAIASTEPRADANIVVETPDPLPPLIGMFVSAVPCRWKTDTGFVGWQPAMMLLPACTPIATMTLERSHASLYESMPPFECPMA